MLLQRTEKAQRELSTGVRMLSLRERSLLLLADGRSLHDLQAVYYGMGAHMVEHLVRQGYLHSPAHHGTEEPPDLPAARHQQAAMPGHG